MKIFFFFLFVGSAFARDYQSEGMKFGVETIVSLDDVIWGFDFLPDGKVLFTERSGKMGILDPKTKAVTLLKNVPAVYTAGQAGLLDVRVHPDFAKNNLIYFSYSEPVEKDKSTTALAKAELKGNELTNVKKIFTGWKPNSNDIHYGSRIVFDGKGHIFFTMGERDNREKAQDISYHQGKVLRINEDGSVPKDNPFEGAPNAKPEIWSYGHRNPQGLVMRPGTDELWESEFGPRGGDELNLIERKKNYGWPIATYGREYHGPKIAEGKKAGTEQPITYWVPSISPSSITFYTGDTFPQWKNNLFLATLSGEHIHRVVLEGKKVVKQEELVKDLDWRFRNVRTGTDGNLWFSTDEGKIGRLIRK
jgi:glucose/arabinose dehydrogenase